LRGKEDRSSQGPSPDTSHRSGLLDYVAPAGIFLAAVAAYLGATRYFFSQDDFTFLSRSLGIAPHPDFFGPLGARVLSTRLYFDMMHGLFGLNAAPYHWASLALHGLNAVLVYALTRLWTGLRTAAIAAGLVFATLDIAFTAVYWISGVQDLLAAFFLLASAVTWAANRKGALHLSLLSAFFLALSLLSKEIGVLAVLAFAAIAWAGRLPLRTSIRGLAPHAAVTAAAAALFAAQSQKVQEGGAYGAGLSSALFHNLSTYIKWTVDIVHPFKDRLAVIDYGAWKIALPAAALALVIVVLLRGARRRHAWASLLWYGLLLAPVLPLLRHTYLYYLYAASFGASVLAGVTISALAAGAGTAARSRAAGVVVAAALIAVICLMGMKNVASREGTLLGPDFVLPHDHVLRASELARAADSTFAEAPVPVGASLVLINPYSPESIDLSGGGAAGIERQSYDMIRSALRNGEVLRVRRPGLGKIDFTNRMDPGYENRHGLLYDAYGRLTYLGTGADIWANLSSVHLLRTALLDESIRCARRALDLAPGHPRANLNLGIALAMTGEEEEARVRLGRAAETLPSESLRAQARKWMESLGEQDQTSQ
jgi:hypothetical protein